MLWDYWRRVRDRIDYDKNRDGTWRGEFKGRVRLSVAGPTLDECQSRLREALEQHVVDMLVGPSESSADKRPRAVRSGKKRHALQD